MSRWKPILVAAAVLASVMLWAGTGRAAKSTVALFNLRPTNMEAMGYSSEILFTLVSALDQAKAVDVMPRREMEELLYQKGLVQGDNPAAVAQAGKVLGVEFVLFGQVTESGGRISARLQLMEVKTGQVRKTWTPTFSDRDAILSQSPAMARAIADTMASGAGAGTAAAAGGAGQPARAALAVKDLRGVSQDTAVMVSWKFDPSQPVSGFHVYRSESANGPYQFMGGTREPRYQDNSVKKGTTYYYRVGILTAQGQEEKSNRTVMVKHSGEKMPHPPILMGGTGHVRRVVFKFVPSLQNEQEKFKINTYHIYRRGGQEGQWRQVQALDAGKKSASDLAYTVEDKDGLDDGLTYEYSVASVDPKKGESPQSDTISVTTIGRPSLKVRQAGLLREVQFEWTPMEAVEGYRLYRKTGKGAWEKVGDRRNSQSPQLTDDSDLADGVEYAYYLTVYDRYGESGPSETVLARTKDLPPAPSGLTAQSGMVKSVRLTWTALNDPDVAGYLIYRGTEAERLKRIDKVRGHDTDTVTDDGTGFEHLDDGTTYFYAVEAYNRFDADGALSPVVFAKTKPRPVAVQGLTAAADETRIVVTWNRNPETDIRANTLYRSQDQGSWSKIEALPPDQTEFQDSDLKPGVSYRYQLIAEDQDGLKSDPAQSVSVASPLVAPEG